MISFSFPLCILFVGLAEGSHDHLGLRRVELLAERFEKLPQILAVHGCMRCVVTVLVALPPQKAGHLVALAAGVMLVEIFEYGFGLGYVADVLQVGVPVVFRRLGHGAFGPAGVPHLVFKGRSDERDILARLVGGLHLMARTAGGRRSQPSERLPMELLRIRTGSSSTLPR